MPEAECDKTCCDIQTEILDLAGELQCDGVDGELAQQIMAAGVLKLLCQSFIVHDAWTPVLGLEQQDTELAFKIVDWAGGSGTKPDVGYIGPDGTTVENFEDAQLITLTVSSAGQNVYIGEYEVTENISSLRLVNIHGNDQIRLADSTLGYEAHGIITASKNTGETAQVFSMEYSQDSVDLQEETLDTLESPE